MTRTAKKQNHARRDVALDITNEIVAAIEAGASGKDWEMPWTTGGTQGLPFNATTGATYRGINVLTLHMAQFAKMHAYGGWATYKQWQAIGAQVRRGERGQAVVYYGTQTRETADGDEETYRFLKHATVFNAEQVEGYEPPEIIRPALAERIEAAEDFAANTGADIRHGQGMAFYIPSEDWVGMPDRDRFKATDGGDATEAYYATLLHELTHWTRHKSRLDRDIKERFGDEGTAMEELIAELGAAFACAHLEIAPAPRLDHARYVDSWLRVLKGDKRAIFFAAARAQEALDYLDGLQYGDQPAAPTPCAPRVPALPAPATIAAAGEAAGSAAIATTGDAAGPSTIAETGDAASDAAGASAPAAGDLRYHGHKPKWRPFKARNKRNQTRYPYPVARVTFADGRAVTVAFWSAANKALDWDRAFRLAASAYLTRYHGLGIGQRGHMADRGACLVPPVHAAIEQTSGEAWQAVAEAA